MKRIALLFAPALLVACSDGTAPTALDGASPLFAAGGTPARYQISTVAYQLAIDPLGNLHNYVVTTNPCDGSVEITGSAPAPYATGENITGTSAGGTISFHSVYTGPFNPGGNYSWDGSFPVAGGALTGTDSFSSSITGTATKGASSATTYKNHGEFVSANPDKNDAAHSCIGMPITQ